MLEPVCQSSTPPIIIGPTDQQQLHNDEIISINYCTEASIDQDEDGTASEVASSSPYISSSSSDQDDSVCSQSQQTCSTAAATLHSVTSSDITFPSSSEVIMPSYPTISDNDGDEYDEEIDNIMHRHHPNNNDTSYTSYYGTVNEDVVSPFERWTTPRIANRKVIKEDEESPSDNATTTNNNNNVLNNSVDFGSDVPSSIAPSSSAAPPNIFADFSFAVADLSMSQFEKFDSEFFAEFNNGSGGKSKKEQQSVQQHQSSNDSNGIVKELSQENSLNYDECRPLDITDINDIVNAHQNQPPVVPSFESSSNNINNNIDEDARYLKEYDYHDEVSTHVNLNSSPHSVMDLHHHHNGVGGAPSSSSFFASSHKDQRRDSSKKKNTTKVSTTNLSYFTESSDSTPESSRDASSSFISSKKSRGSGTKGFSTVADDASSKQSSVVEDIVYSAPMTKLYEFITGDAMCCVSKDQPNICSEYETEGNGRRIRGKKSKKKKKNSKKNSYSKKKYDYEDKESEDDYTYDMSYDDKTYDEGTYDDGTYDMSHDDHTYRQHRRGGSAVSIESSAFYTEDDYDDETVSRASTRSSSHHHVTKSKSHKSKPTLQKPLATTPTIDDGPPLARIAQPRRGSRRGRSPTIRDGFNSDRSLSRGLSRASSSGSDRNRGGHGIDPLKGRDSEEISVVESVLSRDQDNWMEMTVTPSRKQSLANPNFMEHLQSKTASATPSPTKADRSVKTNPPASVYVEEISPETNGYFKVSVTLSV
eukprot:scaffold261_cov58-Cyclotella_meneghiniana.AAC.8